MVMNIYLIKYLTWIYNKLEQINGLRNLENLKAVILNNNQIKDLKPLIGLNNLNTISKTNKK